MSLTFKTLRNPSPEIPHDQLVEISENHALEITGRHPEDDETYIFILLPTGALVLLDSDYEVDSVTFDDPLEQLKHAQNTLSFPETTVISHERADRVSMLLHLGLNQPYHDQNLNREGLADAVMHFNNLYPEAKPLWIPPQRFQGINTCPLSSLGGNSGIDTSFSGTSPSGGMMAWNGVWASTPVNYWIFPTGQVFYFEEQFLEKVFFPTARELCEELEQVIELEFLDPDLDEVQAILKKMIAYSLEGDEEIVHEINRALDWLVAIKV